MDAQAAELEGGELGQVAGVLDRDGVADVKQDMGNERSRLEGAADEMTCSGAQARPRASAR